MTWSTVAVTRGVVGFWVKIENFRFAPSAHERQEVAHAAQQKLKVRNPIYRCILSGAVCCMHSTVIFQLYTITICVARKIFHACFSVHKTNFEYFQSFCILIMDINELYKYLHWLRLNVDIYEYWLLIYNILRLSWLVIAVIESEMIKKNKNKHISFGILLVYNNQKWT